MSEEVVEGLFSLPPCDLGGGGSWRVGRGAELNHNSINMKEKVGQTLP